MYAFALVSCRVLWFSMSKPLSVSPGSFVTKLIVPAMAPPPLKVLLGPLITSMRCRSSGGTRRMSKPPLSPPYAGMPSRNNKVCRPSSPCMRMTLALLTALVCCTCTELMSPSRLATLPGFNEPSSSRSPAPSTSIFCGASSMRLLVRVAFTTISCNCVLSARSRTLSGCSVSGTVIAIPLEM